MINPELGKSYWLQGYGKVWVTSIIADDDGTIFMIRTENVKGKDMGWRYLNEFEEIEE